MKRMLMLPCVLLLMTAAGTGFAQGGGGSTDTYDLVGVYLDAEGTRDCVTMFPVGMHHFYVVLSQLTSPGIRGFELQLDVSGAINYFNFTFPSDQCINMGQREGEIIVGFAQPLMATDGVLMVMEFDGYLADEDPALYYIDHIYFPSLEGCPCYLDSEDVELLKPLYQASGSEEEPVLYINSGHCGPVASEPAAFDKVKSLFR
jgi:hypothetical protein